jgi:hypothetical protein
MDRDPHALLRERLRELAAREAAAEARVRAAGPRIRPGSLLALPNPLAGPLTWLVVEERADELLVRPCDTRPLVLPGDLRLDDGAGGFLAVRTLAGARLPRASVAADRCIDVLPADRLAELPRGSKQVDPARLDDEEIGWAALLVRAAEAVEALAADRPLVVRLRDVVDPAAVFAPDREADESRPAAPRLAAASASAETAYEQFARPRGLIVVDLDLGYPGRIALVATERGVGLLCEPDRPDTGPPAVRRGAAGDGGVLLWDRASTGGAQRIWIDVDWRSERPLLWLAIGIPIGLEVRGGGAFEA